MGQGAEPLHQAVVQGLVTLTACDARLQRGDSARSEALARSWDTPSSHLLPPCSRRADGRAR